MAKRLKISKYKVNRVLKSVRKERVIEINIINPFYEPRKTGDFVKLGHNQITGFVFNKYIFKFLRWQIVNLGMKPLTVIDILNKIRDPVN